MRNLEKRHTSFTCFNSWNWWVHLPSGGAQVQVYYMHLQNQWVIQVLGQEDADMCVFLQDKRRHLNEYLTEVWYSDFREQDPLSEEGEYRSSYDPDWHTQATESSLF